MENRVYEQAAGTSAVVDEGLREYMLKVYNYMAGGLCVTALVAYLIANTSLLTLFFNISPDGRVLGMSALGWISLIAPLIIVFAFGWVLNRGTLAQVQGVFWLYSALMGASLTPIFLVYTSASLTRIFLITAAMFGALSLYGYTTKRNLAGMGSFMMMGLFGIIIAMIVNIFLKSPGLYYALSILSVIIFTGLTAWDTQKIRSMYLAQDDGDLASRKAIAGALELYLDFINLFITLLRLFGDRR